MDRRRCRIHSNFIPCLGTIVAILCALLFINENLLTVAHHGLNRESGHAEMLTTLPSTDKQHISVPQEDDDDHVSQNSLKLRLVHRHDLERPNRLQGLRTPHDRIVDFIQIDEMRVMGFSASVRRARDPEHWRSPGPDTPSSKKHGSQQAPLRMPLPHHPAPAPSQVPEKNNEFGGRVISGASFPGNVGQYFVEFYVGTPGQRLLFITDTGSDLVWVPCSLCKSFNCSSSSSSSSSSSTFHPEASSTFNPIQCSAQECTLIPPPSGATCNEQSPTECTYAYRYSDLSQTIGVFAYDTISVRSSSGSMIRIKDVALGCGTNNTGPSITNVGGVIGLGQGPISFASQVGPMYGGKFSYCFTSFFNRKSRSALVFGDDRAEALFMSPFQYTPFVPNLDIDTFYHLQIELIKVRGQPLPINSSLFEIGTEGNGGVVIDSGTTLTFFLKPAYDVIMESFEKAIPYPRAPPTAGLPLCYNVSSILKPKFPRIAIIFKGGAIFRPPPQNYFLRPTPEVRCLGFMGSAGLSVIGNLIQQNYFVEYDRQNNRLGFAKADCSTASVF